MTFPLQITFRNMPRSRFFENRIRELGRRLERFSSHILNCAVVIQQPHQSSRKGDVFDVHITVTVPGSVIVVHRAHADDASHTDPYIALRDAFVAMRRKLQDHERIQRGETKTHSAGNPVASGGVPAAEESRPR
ncbi:MAG TPA: HPF/RaiA family ribosome-associated protein [Steroidobacteraceae bacterium]|nr:HPF/RaiA family ribosome-associated protein [Steroidobacteraceae bacterium]